MGRARREALSRCSETARSRDAEQVNVIHKPGSRGDACGLGFELATLLPVMMWQYPRRRRPSRRSVRRLGGRSPRPFLRFVS
jgi:hypothetical protein